MSESALLKKIQVALSFFGARLFRNQVGTYELKDGRWLSSGLCPGSSDLIGFVPRVVTPNMIGQKVCVFVAIEVKTPTGRVTREQQHFIDAVKSSGGIAGVVRSSEEAIDLISGG